MKSRNASGAVKLVNRRTLRQDAVKNWQLYLMLLLPVAYIIISTPCR